MHSRMWRTTRISAARDPGPSKTRFSDAQRQLRHAWRACKKLRLLQNGVLQQNRPLDVTGNRRLPGQPVRRSLGPGTSATIRCMNSSMLTPTKWECHRTAACKLNLSKPAHSGARPSRCPRPIHATRLGLAPLQHSPRDIRRGLLESREIDGVNRLRRQRQNLPIRQDPTGVSGCIRQRSSRLTRTRPACGRHGDATDWPSPLTAGA